MAAAHAAAASQRPHRWSLSLQAACLEFAAAGVPLSADLDASSVQHAGTETLRTCCAKALHALLWAAGPQAEPFQPLEAGDVAAALADPDTHWAARVAQARRGYQGMVTALLRAAGQAQGVDAGAVQGAEEQAGASVACAMLFEVAASVCGALPAEGWDRAHSIFSNCMV